MDLSQELTVLVDGKKTTVILAGQTVEIRSPALKIRMVFQPEEGNGLWMGHLLQGNRLFQKNKQLHLAYDKKIGCRTIKRDSCSKMRIRIEMLE